MLPSADQFLSAGNSHSETARIIFLLLRILPFDEWHYSALVYVCSCLVLEEAKAVNPPPHMVGGAHPLRDSHVRHSPPRGSLQTNYIGQHNGIAQLVDIDSPCTITLKKRGCRPRFS